MAKQTKDRLGLGKINFLILALAAVLMVLGYIIMSMNEISISPIILAVVYVAIIPLALLYRPKE
jgi:multisubunit Na+/H+ antiporter MnhB subunit